MTSELLNIEIDLAETPNHDDAIVQCVAHMIPALRDLGVTDAPGKIVKDSEFAAYPASLTRQPTRYLMTYRVSGAPLDNLRNLEAGVDS